MNDKSIKVIKETKSKTFELIMTTVLIAAGINLIVSGICSLMPNVDKFIFIILGLLLISISLILILHYDFLQSCRNILLTASVFYDRQSKSIVRVPNYDFSEDIYNYLKAAVS